MTRRATQPIYKYYPYNNRGFVTHYYEHSKYYYDYSNQTSSMSYESIGAEKETGTSTLYCTICIFVCVGIVLGDRVIILIIPNYYNISIGARFYVVPYSSRGKYYGMNYQFYHCLPKSLEIFSGYASFGFA
jgi:hypothetical protein